MASIINASTAGVGGVITTADNSGDLNIQSGGTTVATVSSTGVAVTGTLSSTGNTTLGDASTDTLNVGNGGLVKDASGHVGIGVTPSAWNLSGYKALEVGAVGNGILSGNNDTIITSNAYYNAGWKYAANYQATFYEQFAGAHIWSTAASGTAGNAITFTQAMTLDSSGNLGIGTTSPTVRLEPSSTTAAVYTRNSWIASNTDNGEVERGGFEISTRNISGSTRTFGVYGYTTDLSTTFRGGLTFKTVNGTVAESMKLTPLGNLELATGHYYALFTGTDFGIELRPTLGTSGAVFASFLNNTGTRIGSISRNTTTNAVLYNTTSDERLKENIADSDSVLETINNIKVRQYDWKDANVHQDYGFIAQELNDVISGVVTKPDDAELMWSVDYSKLTPHLVKAIQEQQALITSLTARLDALENK